MALNTMLVVVIAASCLLVSLIGALLVIRDYKNFNTEKATRASIERAIAVDLHEIGLVLVAFAHSYSGASWGNLDAITTEAVTERLAREPHLDLLYVWSGGVLTPFAASGQGVVDSPILTNSVTNYLVNHPAGIWALHGSLIDAADARDDAGAATQTTLLVIGDRDFALAVTDLYARKASGAKGAEPVLVGLKQLDSLWLARVAANAGNTLISFAADGQPGARLSLPTGENGVSIDIAFAADQPGDRFAAAFGPALVICAAAFCALFVLQIRRIADRLRESEDRARTMASHDPLSGLPNRLYFDGRLDEALAGVANRGEHHALMYLDLDRFKEINDSFGHEAGDQMLVRLAQRVSRIIPEADVFARMGGDEFAILCTDILGKADVEARARRILEQFKEPFDLGERKVIAAASIGIALAPDHAKSRMELAQLADIALYRAKNEGRNRYRVFEHSIGEEMRKRRAIEQGLRHAIDDDQLYVHYQPIYDADARRMVGVEALLRWRHPTLGAIEPSLLVSVAEERGLILRLGEWVLRRACRDAAAWPGIQVAVNVSPIQFRQRDFGEQVRQVLAQTGFDPARLELELTEGIIVSDADQAEEVMTGLRAIGVRMALDDFGTGYSSLIYLRRFPFDKIKIDRSFLESVEATGESVVLIESVVNLGRALGLTVTAEGVETIEQMRLLQAIGCHEMQGFLFSKPVAAADISLLVAASAAKQRREDRAVA
jgi:diguanylate cyclase